MSQKTIFGRYAPENKLMVMGVGAGAPSLAMRCASGRSAPFLWVGMHPPPPPAMKKGRPPVGSRPFSEFFKVAQKLELRCVLVIDPGRVHVLSNEVIDVATLVRLAFQPF